MNKFSKNILIAAISILFLGVFAFGQVAGDVKEEDGDKGSKVIRVGVVMPRVTLKEATGEVDPGAALRNTYAALLNSETIQLVPLDARLTTLALEEAAKKECDYILNLSLIQEEKKRGGGMFGRIARRTGRRATWEAAHKIPGAGSAGGRVARTAARSTIIDTGYTMSSMSVKVKKSDKFILDYFMTTAKGKKVLEKSINAKAKKNNDDKVLIGLIEKSANDIVAALRKRPGRAK